jgi:6-phosphogluconolactonase
LVRIHMADNDIRRFPDMEALSRAAAEFVVEAAEMALARHGVFTLALSGGSTPKGLYSLLASPPFVSALNWEKTHLFWGDERCVPSDHPHSNYRLARETLLDHIDLRPRNIHRIQGELGADKAAYLYQEELAAFFGTVAGLPRFDCILLGLGPDGHTASLFPDSAAARESREWVSTVPAQEIGSALPAVDRVTLTLPVLNRGHFVAFLTNGPSKAHVLQEILHNSETSKRYPAALVQPETQPETQPVWFIDEMPD